MPTIKFSEIQYRALLNIMGYLSGEEKDVQEKHDLPDDFDEQSDKKKIRMMEKAGASNHIYDDICLVSMAIDGEEEEEGDEEEEEEERFNHALDYAFKVREENKIMRRKWEIECRGKN